MAVDETRMGGKMRDTALGNYRIESGMGKTGTIKWK